MCELVSRSYGITQLCSYVQETVKKHGADQVQIWRRSFDIPPPDIDESSEFNPAKELVVENVELTSARSIFSSKSSEMRLHLWYCRYF